MRRRHFRGLEDDGDNAISPPCTATSRSYWRPVRKEEAGEDDTPPSSRDCGSAARTPSDSEKECHAPPIGVPTSIDTNGSSLLHSTEDKLIQQFTKCYEPHLQQMCRHWIACHREGQWLQRDIIDFWNERFEDNAEWASFGFQEQLITACT
mmetsp:Transcript_39290/g.118917  ORF Transcript_39290/g.118917 Transcript_39290/m.118917 type:complete len:151 (-) Transcript_39290:17-469(-)